MIALKFPKSCDLLLWLAVLFSTQVFGQSNFPVCQGSYSPNWTNCVGTYGAPNGDKYIGDFKDGQYDGQGTYFYANGSQYVGHFSNNTTTGQGTYYSLANDQWKGDKYVGSFNDWKFSGRGTYFYANGNQYVGEWEDNKFNGPGIYTFANGTPKQEGIWNNGKFIRAEKVTVESSAGSGSKNLNGYRPGNNPEPITPIPNSETAQRKKCLRMGLTQGSDDYKLCIAS